MNDTNKPENPPDGVPFADLDEFTISGPSTGVIESEAQDFASEGESIARVTFVILLSRIFGLACLPPMLPG